MRKFFLPLMAGPGKMGKVPAPARGAEPRCKNLRAGLVTMGKGRVAPRRLYYPALSVERFYALSKRYRQGGNIFVCPLCHLTHKN